MNEWKPSEKLVCGSSVSCAVTQLSTHARKDFKEQRMAEAVRDRAETTGKAEL